MLRPLYGLNLPYNTACTPSREALDPNVVFVSGQFIKLTNGLADLAVAPSDCIGSEVVFEQNNKNWSGTVPTIFGLLEAETDQYNPSSTYVDRAFLVTRNGVLDVAAPAELPYAIAYAIGVPTNGVLTYHRFVA